PASARWCGGGGSAARPSCSSCSNAIDPGLRLAERAGPTSVRAPAPPTQSLDCSPRTRGAQPTAVLRLALRDCSPRTHGAQPTAVLRLALRDGSPRTHGAQPTAVVRLALRPGGRFGRGRSPPLRVLTWGGCG